MSDALLVLNAGSSSLKCSVFTDEESPHLLLRAQIDGVGRRASFIARSADRVVAEHRWETPLDHRNAIEFLFRWGRGGVLGRRRITAVGHRVVHGGTIFASPVHVDESTVDQLATLTPLAPLHQPHNVAAIRAVTAIAPAMPQVACFDTAFHRTQPEVAQSFALPRRYRDEGIRRYGFHGLSYEYIATALRTLDPRAAGGRTIVAHLGNGASLCAMKNGRSVATTMGFSTLDGLVMGTRCGAIDAGVLLYLLDRRHMTLQALEHLLYEESGLLGASEISSDMRELLASADRRATDAIDLFVYRIDRELGSLAAALEGLDALVFTGGIGEHAAPIRARICRDAAWLGVDIDDSANSSGETRISGPSSRVSAWVIPANEELTIAMHTRQVLVAMR